MLNAYDEMLMEDRGISPASAERPIVINLTPPQSRVYQSKARFIVNVAGRRSGKTYLARTKLMEKASAKRGARVWYVAPTYRMAKQIMWQDIKELVIDSQRMRGTPNETDLSIHLLNGSTIALRGADNPDSLRGVGIDYLVLDEAQDMSQQVWEAVLAPALADRQGEAMFSGTPKGYNWFYDLWQQGHADPSWECFRSTTLESGIVPDEEVEKQRRTMDVRLFRQEFEASFETLAGRVYQPFIREDHAITEVADHGGEVLVGMDFNVNPMCACIAFKVAGQLHITDEIVLPDANTETMARALDQRLAGRQVIIYPDPAGRQRRTSAALGHTDLSILEGYGFTVIAPKRAPLVVDRINEVNAMWENSAGEARMFVHPRCKQLIKSMEGLTYKEGTNQPDKSAGLDHMADALGYLVHGTFPINSEVVGAVRVSGYY